jgi:glycosyltransferase involved in cell wall biosynthesis/SAM-dependent methyltransferase
MEGIRRSGRPLLAVLIATRNRPQLLQRALRSAWGQTQKPDILVLVDDARGSELSPDFDWVAHQAGIHHTEFILLRNRRSKGAPGAWNTGLDELHRRYEDPTTVFVAVLDDDDEWEPDHLHACSHRACESGLQMVVSGIIRFDEANPAGTTHVLPERLDPDELLAVGQHIQGSNLFVRLDKLLEAGLFSEELPSCTDRDLCLKLEELGDVRFGNTGLHTVRHHAFMRGDRCSAPRSPQKQEGLTRFWKKWRERMKPKIENRFLIRAEKLFGWKSPVDPSPSQMLDLQTPSVPGFVGETLPLVVAMATDSSRPQLVRPMLEWLLRWNTESGLHMLQAVVVENGPRPADGSQPLRNQLESFRQKGLKCFFIDHERQKVDAEHGLFEIGASQIGQERLPIAITRTMVAVYAGLLAKQHAETAVWIVDDDYRPYALVDTGIASAVEVPRPDVAELLRLKREGMDIVVGHRTGAAPLPFLATVRTQLLDLKFLLQTLDGLTPETPLPERSVENRQFRQAYRDYYYDSARSDSGQLESPMRLTRSREDETCGDACQRIASLIGHISCGEEVFRPCLLNGEDLKAESQSVLRGGSAIFFNPDHLLAVPNLLARLDGIYTRRSDMVATIIARDVLGLKVVQSDSIAGDHDRSKVVPEAAADFATLVRDVQGYALYSTLRELFEERRKGTFKDNSTGGLEFSMTEMEWSAERFHKLLTERTEAVSLSLWRIMGLTKVLRRLLKDAEQRQAWWPARANLGNHLQSLCDWLEREIGFDRIQKFKDEVFKVTQKDWCNFLAAFKAGLERFQTLLAHQSEAIVDWLKVQRQSLAEARLQAKLGLGALQFLGQGAEGVVFTDGVKCYKFIDAWKVNDKGAKREFLKGLVNRWKEAKTLYPIEALHEDADAVVLVYQYEPGQPYRGGHAPDFIRLLSECRAYGIVFRNLHPKNLIVTSRGLRLIDYGSDIVPWTEAGFLMMAKRAWLTWRWHHRPDLAEVMRKALVTQDLPELIGFGRFLQAASDNREIQQLQGLLAKEVESCKPARVLDYGCGKGKLAAQLADNGLTVVAYDPDLDLAQSWSKLAGKWSDLEFTHIVPDDGACFDVVVCSLVLCALPDGPEYQRVIKDLRKLVRSDGVVFVAVCNPFFTFGGPTPLHTDRQLPMGAYYPRTFQYMERISPAGRPREETHRPLRRLVRDFFKTGLMLEHIQQTCTADRERFEPASDFMTLRLRPVNHPSGRVSLIIKACAMESRTIEAQVHHLVTQLEGPVCFFERILVMDSKQDGFTRQYAEPDHVGFSETCQRLLGDEWIDRIVHAPAGPDAVRALYGRWFGLEATDTHAANGAQMAAVLAGWEACAGDYVLHMDSDVMVCRQNPEHNYLREMIEVLEADPAGLTVSLNISHGEDRPYNSGNSHGPWRVESRAGLIHRQRLFANRPYSNQASNGTLQLAWYRSLDFTVRSGRACSYRGGDKRTFFIHPPNSFKQDVDAWMMMLDFVERNRVPALQRDHCDLLASSVDWFRPLRFEPFIFVICGRNVPPGRFWRCLDSVLTQRRKDWGAIVVDDNSAEQTSAFIELLCRQHPDRITLVRPRIRRGTIANTALAIRQLCGNSDSVILTLDADDALLGYDVLDRVAEEYAKGADVTVGSMLRTDKHRAYPVDFVSPRSSRGGNVWQHLRTFKKYLFDRIGDAHLRLDGEYVDLASDWAFMIPIVEMAIRPVHIRMPLYLYEPFGVGKGQRQPIREVTISRLLAKPTCKGHEDGRLTTKPGTHIEPQPANAI